MIHLITAVPGAGKTLYTVSEVPKLFEGRDIYYYDIPELTLPWGELEDPTKWQDYPDGSVFVIDEAHKAFPKRDYRKPPPDYIEAIAEHRHRGMDFWLITQHPKDLDHFIRNRTNEHVYLESTLLGNESARVFIWKKYQDHPTLPAERERAEEFTWQFPKQSYGLYKSATIHTKRKRPVKKLRAAVAAVVLGVAAAGGLMFHLVNKKLSVSDSELVAENTGPVFGERYTPDDWFSVHTDRVQGLPFTAPVFDDVRKPETYPKLACVASAVKCWCYTEQASRVEVPESMCRSIVDKGYYDYGVGG